MIGENVQFNIEVEDRPHSILLVFDRPCDHIFIPWESAFNLADLMDHVILDVQDEFSQLINVEEFAREQAQIKFNYADGLVALLTEWTDRIRFTSIYAFMTVAKALRITAQDCQLACKGVHVEYTKEGLIKRIHDSKSGTTQQVR